MDDEISVVDQDPFGVVVAFKARREFALAFQALRDLIGNRLDLPRVGAGADQEVIGEGSCFADIEHDNVPRLLGFGGIGGDAPGFLSFRLRRVQFFRSAQLRSPTSYRTTIKVS